LRTTWEHLAGGDVKGDLARTRATQTEPTRKVKGDFGRLRATWRTWDDLVERHFDRLGTLWEHWGGGEVKGDLARVRGTWSEPDLGRVTLGRGGQLGHTWNPLNAIWKL
jgi:hypothetical protein